jgi:hypothetical protein
VHRVATLVLVAVAACRQATLETPTKWLELTPMPIAISVPAYATAAPTQESLDRSAAPGMIISARGCVVVVTPGSLGDAATQSAEIATAYPGATIAPPEPSAAGLYLAYEYAGQGATKLRSFRLEKSIGGTTYRCEPFTGRTDVKCEQAACRSLRAR